MDDAEDGAAGQRPRRETRRKHPKLKYMQMLQDVVDRRRTNITVELDDLEQYEKAFQDEGQDLALVASIEKNAYHYIDIISRAVDAAMPEPDSEPT